MKIWDRIVEGATRLASGEIVGDEPTARGDDDEVVHN